MRNGMRDPKVIKLNTADGRTVETKTYTVDDFTPYKRGLTDYIRKRGIEEAKKEFNSVIDGWENKPVKVMLAEMTEKRIPVGYESSYGRILKAVSVKIWRDIFGQAVRAVRAGQK